LRLLQRRGKKGKSLAKIIILSGISSLMGGEGTALSKLVASTLTSPSLEETTKSFFGFSSDHGRGIRSHGGTSEKEGRSVDS